LPDDEIEGKSTAYEAFTIWSLTGKGAPIAATATAQARQVANATATPTPQVVTAANDTTMVFVPAGPFEMGSNPDVGLAECEKFSVTGVCKRESFEDEAPVHTVTLAAFYIDQYEVTNAQYRRCVEAGVCQVPNCWWGGSTYDDEAKSNHPVICPTWDQAQAYCEWREARLPTEAEWEKAARSTDGRLYPWGDTFDGARLNFCDKNCDNSWANKNYDDGYAETAPVGSYPDGVSPYGAYDMAGNVLEWVVDWYEADYYDRSPSENPTGPTSPTSNKVYRGGYESSAADDTHAAKRSKNAPNIGDTAVGFRCAASGL
jgi:formylglycine-generating enzyme required for sulfatase activity